MVPIDFDGFRSWFTPNPGCSRETWKRLFFTLDSTQFDKCTHINHENVQIPFTGTNLCLKTNIINIILHESGQLNPN